MKQLLKPPDLLSHVGYIYNNENNTEMIVDVELNEYLMATCAIIDPSKNERKFYSRGYIY